MPGGSPDLKYSRSIRDGNSECRLYIATAHGLPGHQFIAWTSRLAQERSSFSTIMSETSPIPGLRAVMFDIGGVVVRSPLLAMYAYEREMGLPQNYLNVQM
jgi:hypothetical protein